MQLSRTVRFEVHRLMCPSRLAIAAAAIIVAGMLSYAALSAAQASAGGSLAGSTAWDVFYIAVNLPDSAGVSFPIGCLVLCGDIFARDAPQDDGTGGMFDVLLVRGCGRRAYWVGKVATVCLTCIAFTAAACIALTAFDCIAFHTGLAFTTPPAWLSYSGNPDEFQFPAGTERISPIPAAWNYGALIASLVVVDGLLCACIVLVCIAATLRTRIRFAALAFGAAVLFAARELPYIWVQLVFLMHRGHESTFLAVPDIGLIIDRFCLGSYALGAGLWDTSVGGPALLARELSAQGGTHIDGYIESIAQGYTVNSFASLMVIVAMLAGWSCLCFAHYSQQDRRGRSLSMAFFSRRAGTHFAPAHYSASKQGRDGVSIRNLTVSYGHKLVLSSACCHAAPTDIVGLMGRNGCGKTTLLRVLAGLLTPDEGSGAIFGAPLGERSPASCGIMFDHDPFIEDRSGLDNLTLIARYCGEDASACDALLTRVGLDPSSPTRVRSYSQGMRKRLALAMALIGTPRLLLLDEPFNGVDPEGLVVMRTIIRDAAASGAIVFISSHQLDELERLCTKVYVVSERRLLDARALKGVGDTLEDVYLSYATKE